VGGRKKTSGFISRGGQGEQSIHFTWQVLRFFPFVSDVGCRLLVLGFGTGECGQRAMGALSGGKQSTASESHDDGRGVYMGPGAATEERSDREWLWALSASRGSHPQFGLFIIFAMSEIKKDWKGRHPWPSIELRAMC